MIASDWIRNATAKLAEISPTPRLDAEVLLAHHLGKERAWLLAHPEYILTQNHANSLATALDRRLKHEPLSYIIGKQQFFGREFKVSPATLQPRPETETMIELLLRQELDGQFTACDVGTGSGCIAITVKLELPESLVLATELNPAALLIAKTNAKNLSANVEFFEGDLTSCLPDSVTVNIVLANLPYVPSSHTINDAAMHEPKMAIFGGLDGLDLYRKMFEQLLLMEHKPRLVLTESLPYQHEQLAVIASKAGYVLKDSEDFIQVFVSS